MSKIWWTKNKRINCSPQRGPRKGFVRSFCIFCFLLFFSAPLHAQEEVSLSKVLTFGDQNHPQLRIAGLQAQAARLEELSIYGKMIPAIRLKGNWLDYGSPIEVNLMGEQELDCTLLSGFGMGDLCEQFGEPLTVREAKTFDGTLQTVFPVSSVYALYQAARLYQGKTQASKEAYRLSKADIRVLITEKYMELLTMRQGRRFSKAMVKRLQEHRKSVAAYAQEGMASKIEVSRIEAGVAEANLAAKQAELGELALRKQLALLVGKNIEPSPIATHLYRPLQWATTKTQQSHPAYQKAKSTAQVADANRKVKWSNLLPSVNLVYGQQWAEGRGDLTPAEQQYVGVMVSSDFEWGSKLNAARAANREAAIAKLAFESQSDAIRLQLQLAPRQADLAYQALLVARQKHKVAQEAQRQVSLQFDQQMVAATKLLTTESELVEAGVAVAQAEKQYMVAVARCQHALGLPVAPLQALEAQR